jgi:MSHA biogenesis protein MshJ
MNKQWKILALKLDALSQRERAILFIAIGAVLLFLGHAVMWEPQLKQKKMLAIKHQQNLAQVSTMQVDIAQRTAALGFDPDAEMKQRITEARNRLQAMDEDMFGLQENLVRPEKMDVLLETILKRNKRLQLLSLRSLPVVDLMELSKIEGMIAPSQTNQSAPTSIAATTALDSLAMAAAIDERSIYKHEVELVLQGNYLDMLSYMRELEAMPERVYWSKSSLKVIEYPKASLSLHLFTLSLEKKWLNL